MMKPVFNEFSKIGLAALCASTLILSGCLGGGSSSSSSAGSGAVSLTGIAAAGEPISGDVTSKDSKGKSFGPAKIDSAGKYTLDVTGGAAPFVIEAKGTVAGSPATYYSAASTAGPANVTPFTTMIVAQATNRDPATAFQNCDSTCVTSLSSSILATAQTNVKGSLSDLLNKFGVVPADTDLMTTTFVAGKVTGQSKIDILLDSIIVAQAAPTTPTSYTISASPALAAAAPTVPANTVLVTLPVVATTTPATVIPALTAKVVANVTTVATTTAAQIQAAVGATPIAAIQSGLTAFQNLFATAAPADTVPLLPMFDATFLNDGLSGAQFATSLLLAGNSSKFQIGCTFSAPKTITPPDANAIANDATHQWFETTYCGWQPLRWLAIKQANGSWLMAGNQRQIGVRVMPFAGQTIPLVGLPIYQSGISIWFTNSTVNLGIANLGLTSATVSGPGLIGPTAGVPGTVSFVTAGVQSMIQPCAVAPAVAPTTNCVDMATVVPGNYVFTLSGTTPGVGGAAYTYTYTEAYAGTKPPALATLTPALFPAITSVAPTAALIASGTNLTVTWTIPGGHKFMQLYVYGSSLLGAQLFGGAYVDAANPFSYTVPLNPAVVAGSVARGFLEVSSTLNGVVFFTDQAY